MRTLIQSNYDGFIQINKYDHKSSLTNNEYFEYEIFDKRRPDLSIRIEQRRGELESDGVTTINWWGDGRATIQELRNFQRLLDKADELIREEN